MLGQSFNLLESDFRFSDYPKIEIISNKKLEEKS